MSESRPVVDEGDQALVDKMDAVWRSIDDLCSLLGEHEWKAPTDCPGWTVQDNVAHLAGSEATFLGRPAPDHVPEPAGHVKNPLGERNEVQVDYRRSWTGKEVLREFREVTAERLAQFRSMTAAGFAEDSWTPMGPGTVRDLLALRIFDAWVHEQDIRRALGRSGHLEGPVADHAYGRIAQAMPYVVGRKVGASDGTSVVFVVEGTAGGTLAIHVEGGRAKPVAQAPDPPTVELRLDLETFSCLGCGRWDPAATLERGKVRISGDQELGRRIVHEMSFMI